MFLDDMIHLVFGEDLEDGRCGEPKVDGAALFHEKGAIVNDTAFEQALNHKLLLLELCVDLDHTRLQEVQLVGISPCFLELSALDHGFCVKEVDDVVKDRVVIGKISEVRHLLHRTFDEVKHLVLIIVNACLDLLKDLGLHRHDFLILLLGELAQGGNYKLPVFVLSFE